MALASSAASASRGAAQPAGARVRADADIRTLTLTPGSFVTVASFNFGFVQDMMTGRTANRNSRNFGRVCAKIVEAADADLLFGCEVGGFRQGLRSAGVSLVDILTDSFGQSIRFSEITNHVSVWNFGGASQPAVGGASQPAVVRKFGLTETFCPPSGRAVDAVIERFDVETSGHGRVHLITANMHIVCGKKPPSVATRQRAVTHLKRHLDRLGAPAPNTPVVRLVVGDNNLIAEEARQAFQRATDDEPLWKVYESPADLKGDHVAVCGADASFVSVAVGKSYKGRGMRNDSHDVVAVVLSLPGASQPGDTKRRRVVVEEISDDGELPAPRGEQPAADPPAEAEAEALDESVDYAHSPTPLAEDDVTDEARALHTEMRDFWDQRYECEYDKKLLNQLSLLLFKKRKSPQPADEDRAGAPQPSSDAETAYASQAETVRAIVSVLQIRQDFLARKNIDDLRYVLSEEERGELVRHVRKEYEQTDEQVRLQQRDAEVWRGLQSTELRSTGRRGKGGKGKDRGARQPAGKGGKAEGAGTGSLNKYVNGQKRKRWHRHLQRICGTKQIWEVLAFSGRFDVRYLTQALHVQSEEEPRAQEPQPLMERVPASLHHEKAEAIARHKEGERLNRRWQELERGGATQPARHFTRQQLDVLESYESGELLRIRNNAILALGHGRLRTARGETLDIGGSTGCGPRRILDCWHPPDWRQFLEGEGQR